DNDITPGAVTAARAPRSGDADPAGCRARGRHLLPRDPAIPARRTHAGARRPRAARGGARAARAPRCAPRGRPHAGDTAMTRPGTSLPIDVRIPGVGRVKKRSGVFTRGERDDLVAMLRLLPKQGHGALVEDIQAGRRTVLEVYRHYVENTLAQLRGPQDDQALAPLLDPWLDTA